jgi:hypothetical protein
MCSGVAFPRLHVFGVGIIDAYVICNSALAYIRSLEQIRDASPITWRFEQPRSVIARACGTQNRLNKVDELVIHSFCVDTGKRALTNK